MKYGIITFHNIPNFGAVLQTFALCRVIRDMGIDCDVINYQCENLITRELVFRRSKNFLISIYRYLFSWSHTKRRISECEKFWNEVGVIGKEIYNKDNIKSANLIYDVFISGSDMIWDTNITNHDMTYFLSFVEKNKKRISYGSSTGSIWNDDIELVVHYLKKYEMLSVRERNVLELIEMYGLTPRLVADPTMLLSKQYWKSLCHPCKEHNYVLVYFPTNGILELASLYAKRNKKRLLVIENMKKSFALHKTIRVYNPYDWMSYINEADVVFTNSYHGMLFSLYFHKEFWTNNGCNRIETVLNYLGLEDRILEQELRTSHSINYHEVDKKIMCLVDSSKDFLTSALKQ